MHTTIVTNAYVVTVDRDRRVIPDGWIAFEGDRITGVGDMADPDWAHDDARVVDAGGKLAVPGLINGHNHHWASLFKNTGEGLLLEDWIDQVTFPLGTNMSVEDIRIAAYLGAIEQLRTGTTCSLNHTNLVTSHEVMQATIEPVLEVGIRQLVTKEVRGTPEPAFNPDHPVARHVRSLPDELSLAEEVVDRWDGRGGLIRMGLAIESGAMWMLHNATSEDTIREGVALAQRRQLKITNHCSAGTPWRSIKEFHQRTAGGDVDFLVRLGAMTDNWVLAHALWLTEREMDAVASSGASVITNPVSNAYSCDGMMPMRRMMAAGINVGLGSDGAYVNGSVDMVEQMKFCVLMQNVTHMDPTLLTAEHVLEMATIRAAQALGLDHDIGSIEVGKKADIAIFDLGRAHATVGNRPVAALVFSAHGTDVDTVIVDGRIRLQDGDLVDLPHEQEILMEATRRAAEVIDRAGLTQQVFRHWRPTGW